MHSAWTHIHLPVQSIHSFWHLMCNVCWAVVFIYLFIYLYDFSIMCVFKNISCLFHCVYILGAGFIYVFHFFFVYFFHLNAIFKTCFSIIWNELMLHFLICLNCKIVCLLCLKVTEGGNTLRWIWWANFIDFFIFHSDHMFKSI